MRTSVAERFFEIIVPDGRHCGLGGSDKPWSALMAADPLGELCFDMASCEGEPARDVIQPVRIQTLWLPRWQGPFFEARCASCGGKWSGGCKRQAGGY